MKIDLENIVYFRSDTHYFVMTAKKDSLLERGVIKKDTYDRDTMLRSDNIDRKQLEKFAIDASQVRIHLVFKIKIKTFQIFRLKLPFIFFFTL